MAVGADARPISRLVLESSLRLVIAGSILSVAATIAAARTLQSQLFAMRATHPAILVIVTVWMAVVLRDGAQLR